MKIKFHSWIVSNSVISIQRREKELILLELSLEVAHRKLVSNVAKKKIDEHSVNTHQNHGNYNFPHVTISLFLVFREHSGLLQDQKA